MPMLLTARTTDFVGAPLQVHPTNGDGSQMPVPAATLTGTVYAWGTFDGAAVYLEHSPDGVEWFRETGLTFTAEGAAAMQAYPFQVRAVVESAGALTSVNLAVRSPMFSE